MTSRARRRPRTHIIQGEFVVTDNAETVVTTVLGSCVAACIWDTAAGVGGVNHFLLPGHSDAGGLDAEERLGVHLMELLVNGLLKAGARRDRLKAKLFGGARAIKGLADIGKHNIAFAERFLFLEGIAYVGGSTSGDRGRRIECRPVLGRVRQVYLTGQDAFAAPAVNRALEWDAGELELF